MVKRGTKKMAVVHSFVLQWVHVQAEWCFFVQLAASYVCDGYLVVVVFVEVVKELFCKTAKEDRTEEVLEARFVLLHQTVTVDVQAVKDNLQGIDNLHVVELLDGTFSIFVCVQVGRQVGNPPAHERESRALHDIRAPENRI